MARLSAVIGSIAPRHPSRRRTGAPPAVESLEDRRLLAARPAPIGPALPPLPARANAALPRLDAALIELAQSGQAKVAKLLKASGGSPLAFVRDDDNRVAVSITANDVDGLLAKLASLDFVTTAALSAYHTIEGFMPAGSLAAAAALGGAGLMGITPIYAAAVGQGAVNSQADFVLEADRVRNTPATGANGSGVRVGVLSDSFNRLNGYAADVASGDLPSNVQVVAEGPTGSSDEGRAMLQLVNDLAPGAGLAFATAFNGQADFANQIRNLANPALGNCKVITDDVFYFEEPQFQDGVIAQAINDVATSRDVAYFALAGNLGSNAYESTNVSFASDASFAGRFYDFDPGAAVDTRQRITVAAGQTIVLNLQWDDPFYTTNGVDTDLDIVLLNGNTVVATSNRDSIVNQTPSELLSYTNSTSAAQSLDLAIQNYAGPNPGRLKYVNYGANSSTLTINEFNTNSPTVIPHSAAAGGASVAAAAFTDQLAPESFSSLGPFTALYSPAGVRLATPDVRQAPDFTAIDGTDTTFFGGDFDGNGRPNFFGTSAAAPHAAAVGALVRSALPSLTAAQTLARIANASTDITAAALGVAAGTDARTGSGLINAYDAIYGPAVAAIPPIRDGFESSALSIDWETYGTGAARTLVTTANGPATGSYHLTMDASAEGISFGLNEATLRINPAGLTGDLLLAFREKEFLDEDDPMPATFTGHNNSDGVALSADGVNWFRLVSLTGAASAAGYQNFSFDLTAAAAAAGITLGANTRVRFQHYDNFGIPTDGFAFDDVRIANAARVTAVTVDDGTAQRSSVRRIDVDVNGVVATAPGSAFTVTRAQDGATFAATVAAIGSFGPTSSRVRLAFSGTGTEFGSLPDGDYTLSINGNAILDDLGFAIDADANGTPGGTASTTFFRLFGDADGDRDVDATDFNAFRVAYASQASYVAYFDYDNDGTVANDIADRDAFLARRGKKLTAAGVVFA